MDSPRYMTPIFSRKVNPIRQITLVKKFLKRWKGKSMSKRRTAVLAPLDSEPSCPSPRRPNKTVPSGFFAVYVGASYTRFLVPTQYLNLPIFISLLQRAEEEYGFQDMGGLALPCEVDIFEQVLTFLEKDEKKYGRLGVDEFLKVISDDGVSDFSTRKENERSSFLGMPPVQKLSEGLIMCTYTYRAGCSSCIEELCCDQVPSIGCLCVN